MKKLLFLAFLSSSLVVSGVVFASSTNGTIDSTNKYAWSENIGWINFGSTSGNVTVTDNELTGYGWSDAKGWISLNCSNTNSCASSTFKVENNGEGTLSGYAWGEAIGWINFDGVTIDSSGNFSGYASGTVTGRISFNCSNTDSCSSSDFKVSTDWRAQSSRAVCNNATDDDGDGYTDYPADTGCTSLTDDDETNLGSSLPPAPPTGTGTKDAYVRMFESSDIGAVTEEGSNVVTYVNTEITFDSSVSQKHTAEVLNLDMEAEEVTILFKPDGPELTLDLTEVREIDLDNDGVNDIEVTFQDLVINRVELTLKDIIPESVPDNIIEAPEDLSEGTEEEAIAFFRYLGRGMSGNDVLELQKYLNNQGFILAEYGPGSPGNETFYFGPLTQDALKRFQNAKKLPENGYLDSMTRDYISMFDTIEPPRRDKTLQFSRNLRLGMRGEDVRRLQSFLNKEGYPLAISGPGSVDSETLYFGYLTQKALIQFQRANNLPSYGYFGPLTRKLIK